MNYKTIKILVALTFLFAFSTQPLSAASKTIKIKVTFVSAEMTENNHVGNDWYVGASVNGKEIEEGSSVTLNLKSTDSVKLVAEAEEQDKIPDTGSADSTIKVSSITKKLSKTLNVKVVENRGRYSGNVAKWKFTFKIQKQ